MKQIVLLSRYGGKTDGQSFPASEWNQHIADITAVCQMGAAPFAAPKIEQYVYEREGVVVDEWVDITATAEGYILAGGETYRLSGFFASKVTITEPESEQDTKIILNNCLIVSNDGTCLLYDSDIKELVVECAAGSKNYMIQTSIDETYIKKGALNSENNLTVTGAGLLYLENAIGHGVRGSKLNLRGENCVIVKAAHDGFHGSKILDIYHGEYYVLEANDAFGAGNREEGEEHLMRGVIRVFGGTFHINKVNQKVFDAKFEVMKLGSDENYYSENDEIPEGVTISQVWNSGFHTLYYIVDGEAVESSNLTNKFTDQIPTAAGHVMLGEYEIQPTLDQDNNNVYTIDAAAISAAGVADATGIVVTGVINGTIVCAVASPEVHLQHAIINAPTTGAKAGIAIEYTVDSKNMQVQTDSGTEASYVFGTIVSIKNLKITPKGSSVLHVEAPGVGADLLYDGIGINGSTVEYSNGGGSIFITNCRIGSMGTEQWIGNDDKYAGKSAGKNLSGDLYVFGNKECDIKARLNTDGTKKGFFEITPDFEGNAFAGVINTNLSHNLEAGATSGVIIGITKASGKLYYQKNFGVAQVTKNVAVKYTPFDGNQMVAELY